VVDCGLGSFIYALFHAMLELGWIWDSFGFLLGVVWSLWHHLVGKCPVGHQAMSLHWFERELLLLIEGVVVLDWTPKEVILVEYYY
jgi:hypothetical protein